MTVSYAIDDLSEDRLWLMLSQAALPLDELEQVASCCVLKRHVHVVGWLKDLKQADDVLVSDSRHQGHFTPHFLDLARLQSGLLYHLDSDRTACQSMNSKSYFTKGTLADDWLHIIASQGRWEVIAALLSRAVMLADGQDQRLILVSWGFLIFFFKDFLVSQ